MGWGLFPKNLNSDPTSELISFGMNDILSAVVQCDGNMSDAYEKDQATFRNRRLFRFKNDELEVHAVVTEPEFKTLFCIGMTNGGEGSKNRYDVKAIISIVREVVIWQKQPNGQTWKLIYDRLKRS